jgi:hypothetical protein
VAPCSELRAAAEMSLSLIAPFRISEEPTARLRISLELTAFLRICADPTLLRGSVSAAKLVPPSAMKSASVAMMLA